ncbi:MAG: hypothetical protein CMJ83_06715 [Planctomycetes bacterium]|nr:hypothetical protein [Planctomycetota bacterium]
MMSIRRGAPLLVAMVVAAVTVGLAGCGGGGGGDEGGGGGGGSGDALVVSIRLLNVPTPNGFDTIEIWNSQIGVTSPNPPGGIPLNVAIEIVFAGNVNGATLPSGGVALGSINITTTDGVTTVPAFGSFGVSDDPAGPANNQRIVTFLPTPPTDPMNPAQTAGFGGNVPYTVFIPRVGASPQVVQVAGSPLQNDANATFVTCDPATNPLGAAGCFTDPVPGPPHVEMTIPASDDPSPMAIDPMNVVNDTVTVLISEPLFPAGINLQNVRLVNAGSGAQVPGTVQFFQAGTPEAGPDTSRIDYIASSSLLANASYEIQIDPAVQDFGGNSVVLYDPNEPTAPPSGQRFFSTIVVPFCTAPAITEDFTSTVNRDTLFGAVTWDGSGQLFSEFPFDLVGGGAFGNLAFAAGPGTLDSGMAATAGFSEGNWEVVDFTVAAMAVVRAIGPYRAHMRCLGIATISGTINGNAGQNAFAPITSPEAGPGGGLFNNGGNVANSIVRGGNANCGAGGGGRASQEGFTVRTEAGESGFGPTVNGAPNPGPFAANPSFGGGQGGDGGFRFPSGGVVGELGGLGGAGGSAWATGGNGQPFTVPLMGCTPFTPAAQNIATATPVPPIMIFPITIASAGSGGGGGGDRQEVAGPTSDDQGGGGGGGGGGFRCSAIGNVDVQAGAILQFNGANGGNGNTFFGGGGAGGSGGEIWLQSFSDVLISAGAQLQVTNGAGTNLCGDHASGPGGNGLYQFEDADGMINTNFLGGQAGGMNVNVELFPFSTTVSGIATSVFFDTAYGDPDYDPTSVVETIDFGANPAPGSSVVIEYQGAFESLTGGQPDLNNLSAFVVGTDLNMLDGYRYIRFRVTISYDAPNAAGTGTTPANTLPTVSDIRFEYSIPCTLLP